jgi:hypothetical protein
MKYGITTQREDVSGNRFVCEDSDDNGERPNTTPISSLPLSRKTTLDKENHPVMLIPAMRISLETRLQQARQSL